MTKSKRTRKSLSLRLQPYSGTPLAEVTDYLNSLEKEDMARLVGEILVMALLPHARHDNNFTEKQLKNTFLIARDMHEKHLNIMALALGVDASIVNNNNRQFKSDSGKVTMSVETEQIDQAQTEEDSLITPSVSAADIGRLFD